MGEESSPPNRIALPSVTITEPYWIRYNNRTYMEKGQGPYQMMQAEIDDAVKKIDSNWAIKFGTDKTKWPFDTLCCATPTYRRMAICKKY